MEVDSEAYYISQSAAESHAKGLISIHLRGHSSPESNSKPSDSPSLVSQISGFRMSYSRPSLTQVN